MTATLRLSTIGFGKLSRSDGHQQQTRRKPEDKIVQLNPLNITVPDHLTLTSRSEVNIRTRANGFDTLGANWFSLLSQVGRGSGKLVKFKQHTRKKLENEKTQLNLDYAWCFTARPIMIRLVYSHSTLSQISWDVLRNFLLFLIIFREVFISGSDS